MTETPYRTAAEMFEAPRRRPLLPRLKLALAYSIVLVVVEALATLFVCACSNVQSWKGALITAGVMNALVAIVAAVRWSVITIANAKDLEDS
ncbi:MAG TPA: hypothetical protein VM430_08260 [Microbacterium sp.]|jgi:hypothetical protein|nr:hypothetical protein [Microbacterium sp.]